MNRIADLPAKLDMLLKASSLSRVALAQKVGVDKSLVGRWVKGTVHPGEHNMVRISAVFRECFPALTLADWYDETAQLAARIGIPAHNGTLDVTQEPDGPFAMIAAMAAGELAFRGASYEGFWRTSRPSVVMPEQRFHDYGMFRLNDRGMLEVTMEGAGLKFSGWMFPMAGNLNVFLFDPVGRTPLVVLMKGVSLPRAMSMEGILLMSALDPARTPAAVPIVLERLGDLSGDRAADDAELRRIVAEQREPIVPLDQTLMAKALYRDIGPEAAEAGGSLFFTISGALSLGQTTDRLHG